MFEKELQIFHKRKSDLVSKNQLGGFVVIKDEEVLGVWVSRIDALKAGIDKYGDVPFLVKNISDPDATINFTRNVKFAA
jgi:hypothetical protein